ncbi:MAG: hypothetical protein A2551_07935 [Elusimicrobia bacterium RIFOXYD2_FULL_34_30]|nr:MAG: hypothetical protein A2551_07935 [Elusimicrobia bacterium RIFOXYD2_FULL_34_30]
MKKYIFVIIFFAFLTLLFLPKIFLMSHMPITPGLGGSDITDLNYPYKHILSQSIKKFEIPTWSNLTWCGYPLHAEGQGGFFYPLNVIIFFIFSPDIGFNLSIIINFILCGLFSFLFFNEIGLKRLASIISATIFSFSGFFFCHIQHLNMLNSVIWFPLIFYFFEKYFKTGKFKYIIFSGIALGIQILAGFPQFVYYTIVLSFFYFIFNLKKLPVLRAIISFSAFIIIGLCISAIQWLPTLELVNFTARKTGFAKDAARWWWSYNFSDIITWIFPFSYGSPYDNSYIKMHSIFFENSFFFGKIALIIGLFGLYFNLKKFKYFVYLIIITLIISLASSLGINKLLDMIPGFEQFRLHQRTLIFAVFSICLFLGHFINKLKSDFLKILIFILVIIELLLFAQKQNAFYNRISWLSTPPSVDFIKNDTDFFRVWNINSFSKASQIANGFSGNLITYFNYKNFLQPNSNIIWNIPAIEGHGALRPKRFYEIWDKMVTSGIGFETLRFIGFAGGKYIITTYSLLPDFVTFRKDFEFYENMPTIKIYENKLYSRKVFFANNAIVLPENRIIDKLFEKNFDIFKTVILEEYPDNFRYEGTGSVNIKKYSEKEIEFETESDEGGFLVLNDTWYPGWEAYVNGKKFKIFKADYLFRALEIPKGNCSIKLAYNPKYYNIGKIVSIFTFFCLIFILFFYRIIKI